MPNSLVRGARTAFLTLAVIASTMKLAAAQSPATQSPATKAGDITIAGAFTREPPNGARVAGGFMTITNAGPMPDRLIGGNAAFAKRFEVHEMAMDGGMMKMRELPKGLEIKPGEKVDLRPGGYHVMFLDLTEAPVAGKPLKVKLRFEKAGEVEIDFAVVPMGAGAPKSQHQH
jgi:periplasmic copper chaperone A